MAGPGTTQVLLGQLHGHLLRASFKRMHDLKKIAIQLYKGNHLRGAKRINSGRPLFRQGGLRSTYSDRIQLEVGEKGRKRRRSDQVSYTFFEKGLVRKQTRDS